MTITVIGRGIPAIYIGNRRVTNLHINRTGMRAEGVSTPETHPHTQRTKHLQPFVPGCDTLHARRLQNLRRCPRGEHPQLVAGCKVETLIFLEKGNR